MFPIDSGIDLEGGNLRSERIFCLRKRRKIVTRGRSCSMARGEDYKITSNLKEGYFDKKEEYQLISEREEEKEA